MIKDNPKVILFVHDETTAMYAVEDFTAYHKYIIFPFTDSRMALDAINGVEVEPLRYDLLITDLAFEDHWRGHSRVAGDDIINASLDRNPSIPIWVASAMDDDYIELKRHTGKIRLRNISWPSSKELEALLESHFRGK